MKELIKNAWIHRSQILQGIINRLFSSEKVKEEAKRRLSICELCPFNSKNTKTRPFGLLPYNHCIKCGCSLQVKPYSTDAECPKGYWEGKNLDQYEKIKIKK